MDSNTEDRVGTLVKVTQFLSDYNTFLAANTAIEDEHGTLGTDTEEFFQQDSIATRNLGGFTEVKTDSRKILEDRVLLIRAALVSYYTANPDPRKRVIMELTDTEIKRKRDSELYVFADQVNDLASPVKALLVPFQVTEVQVDELTTFSSAYREVLQLPRSEEGISIAAGKEGARLLDKSFNVTLPKLDAYLLPFKYSNLVLYDKWLVARAIDNSGGGSDSAGYTLTNLVLAPGATASFGDAPAADKHMYFRQIGGSAGVVACAAATISPCATGYTLTPNDTVKLLYGDLGISGGGPLLNFTNPGTETVTVRVGLKNE